MSRKLVRFVIAALVAALLGTQVPAAAPVAAQDQPVAPPAQAAPAEQAILDQIRALLSQPLAGPCNSWFCIAPSTLGPGEAATASWLLPAYLCPPLRFFNGLDEISLPAPEYRREGYIVHAQPVPSNGYVTYSVVSHKCTDPNGPAEVMATSVPWVEPTPTATPTATGLPPTWTPVPPTATPTAVPAGSLIRSAWVTPAAPTLGEKVKLQWVLATGGTHFDRWAVYQDDPSGQPLLEGPAGGPWPTWLPPQDGEPVSYWLKLTFVGISVGQAGPMEVRVDIPEPPKVGPGPSACRRPLWVPLVQGRTGVDAAAAAAGVTAQSPEELGQAAAIAALPVCAPDLPPVLVAACPGATRDWSVTAGGTQRAVKYACTGAVQAASVSQAELTLVFIPTLPEVGPVLATIGAAAGAAVVPVAIIVVAGGGVYLAYQVLAPLPPEVHPLVAPSATIADEWITGRVAGYPTGSWPLTPSWVESTDSTVAKYFEPPADWGRLEGVSLIDVSAGASTDQSQLALLLMATETGRLVAYQLVATNTDGVALAVGTGDTMVQRAWREGYRTENGDKLRAPAIWLPQRQEWAPVAGAGVTATLHLAAGVTAETVAAVVSAGYLWAGGDDALGQSLPLVGGVQIDGVMAYAVYGKNEWYSLEETTQIAGSKYRPFFLPEAETSVQDLEAALALVAASVLDHIDAAEKAALARVADKRAKCQAKGRFWDEAHEKCRPSQIELPDRPRQPTEDRPPAPEPDLPQEKETFPVVALPPTTCNGWGHARRTRGPGFCDDVDYHLHNGVRWWWDFLGYIVADEPRAAYLLWFSEPVDIEGRMLRSICVPVKWSWDTWSWYIPTAVDGQDSVASCLKPEGRRVYKDRLFPPPLP